ncbi:MAG: cytochrome c [Desulfobulbaceae bacterium]|nr:cytochrome c [Desulfobulbaceae bacterium]
MFKRYYRNRLLVFYMLASCLLLVTVGGCSNDTHDHPKLVTGEQLFDYHCSGCHKKTGKGNFLKGVPANRDTALSSGQIKHKITIKDKDGAKMPSFPKMSEAEAAKIASYLKQLK